MGYCSREHQRKDWKHHKFECNSVKKKVTPAPTPEEAIGMCGIHSVMDLSGYVHALNNMAGQHKVDMPMSLLPEDGETLIWEQEHQWSSLDTPQRLPNGLLLLAGCKYMRCMGNLGFGKLLRGPVKLCSTEQSSNNGGIVVEFSGKDDFCYQIEDSIRIGQHIQMLSGSKIDAFAVLHGPLIYAGEKFDTFGGVHYNGSAFRLIEGKTYNEVCIDKLLHTAAEENAKPSSSTSVEEKP